MGGRGSLDMLSSTIVARKDPLRQRRIGEAIEIECQAPTLNRGIAGMKFQRFIQTFCHVTVNTKSRDKTSS